jgi:mannose-6-phosphate isomerase-like protein (cupin superfamily)
MSDADAYSCMELAVEAMDSLLLRVKGSGLLSTFAFETYDTSGTFVPPHIHPGQDEFMHMIEGQLEVELDGQRHQAPAGSLVKMPRGVPHAYYNNSEQPTRCLFWVSPAGRLKELFDQLHEMGDVEEGVRVSAEHDVDFLPPKE